MSGEPTTVRVEDGCVRVEGWSTCDPEVARYLDQRAAGGEDLAAALEHALRVGVLALDAAGVTMNVEHLDRELERFTRRIGEHFDPQRRDSALGRMQQLLGEHLDGEGSTLHKLLDLTNDESPLASWRGELQGEFERQRRLIEAYRRELAEQAAAQVAAAEERARAEVAAAEERARAEVAAVRTQLETADLLEAERDKGTAKGRAFEDLVFDTVNELACVFGDSAEPTGHVAGLGGSKKGDVVVHLNHRDAGGLDLRLVVEAKDQPLGLTPTLRELDGAKDNRGAVAAIAVFAQADQMPTGAAPFRDQGQGRYVALLDKDDPDERLPLQVAYRLARVQALAELQPDEIEVDARGIRDDVEAARHQLQSFSTLKSHLTRLRNSVNGGIDDLETRVEELRSALLECLDRLDTRVTVHDADGGSGTAGLSVA